MNFKKIDERKESRYTEGSENKIAFVQYKTRVTELDSSEENQGLDSSLQLSKSSVSQSHEPGSFKFKVLSPARAGHLENSMKTISDLSFNENDANCEIATEGWRMSEAVTSAKNSFYEGDKETEEKFAIHFTSFAVPSRMFCQHCGKENFTVVSTQYIEPRFWDSIENFINSFVCCEDRVDVKQRQLVHTCSKCHKVLARIFPGV